MERYPALACLEFSSIPSGILAGDTMVKRAPISVLKAGTVHAGKYLILIGGSVASVEEAYFSGLSSGGDKILDRMFLPDVHDQVYEAVLGQRRRCSGDALGILETNMAATIIRSADAGIKGADVDIVEIRLADDLGGKGIALLAGRLEEVEAAVQAAQASAEPERWCGDIVIPRLHAEMSDQIEQSTVFSQVSIQKLAESEV